MKQHQTEARLNDYVDGALAEQERRQVEEHLEVCSHCRDQVADIQSLVADAAELPRKTPLPRDLWPAIAQRIDQQKVVAGDFGARPRTKKWFYRAQLAAAALALLAVSSTVTAVIVKRGENRPRPTALDIGDLPSSPSVFTVGVQSIEDEYNRAFADLYSLLNQRRDELDPQMIAAILENLEIIDAAIREARAALTTDPSNRTARHRFTGACQDKVELLQRATTLAARS